MKTISKINHTEDTLKMNQLALKATEKVFLKARR